MVVFVSYAICSGANPSVCNEFFSQDVNLAKLSHAVCAAQPYELEIVLEAVPSLVQGTMRARWDWENKPLFASALAEMCATTQLLSREEAAAAEAIFALGIRLRPGEVGRSVALQMSRSGR